MSDIALSIEPARDQDRDAIEKLHARAFGPGRYARTAFRIREQAKDGSIAFVARVGSLLVGSVLLTPVKIDANAGLMLGPLTVEPAFEGRGVGRALLEKSAQAGQAGGYSIILLVGDEPYYARHGYKRIPFGQITLPGPVDPGRFLALDLVPDALKSIRGEVRGGS